MSVTGMQKPDFRTVNKFRARHLMALSGLFVQILKLYREAGLVSLGHEAIDGTKLEANASKHKAMSYTRMKKAEPEPEPEPEPELEAIVQGWLDRAAQPASLSTQEVRSRAGHRSGEVCAGFSEILAAGHREGPLRVGPRLPGEQLEEARRRQRSAYARTNASCGRQRASRTDFRARARARVRARARGSVPPYGDTLLDAILPLAMSRESRSLVPIRSRNVVRSSPDDTRYPFIATVAGLAVGVAAVGAGALLGLAIGAVAVIGSVAGLLIGSSIKFADQWEKAVVLRMGRYRGLRGPGLFFVIPILDRVGYHIDQRIRTTDFGAESCLTKDTVPVNVDAIAFWVVYDAERAALEVQDYMHAVVLAAQTALRDAIGKHDLAELIQSRKELGRGLQQILDVKMHDWGIEVQSVEIRDVIIPHALEEAMSRQAQAERERQARIILGTAETEIASKFVEAAKSYESCPTAMNLRAMNMLYESIVKRGSLMVVPSGLADSLNLPGLMGLAGAAGVKAPGQVTRPSEPSPRPAPVVAPPIAPPKLGSEPGEG